MDKQEQYRKLIKQILIEHVQHKFSYGDIKIETIFDDKHNHYQLFHIGWHGNRHVYGCVMHLEIENGKIWIHHDDTEIGVANELVELGVPKDRIVLAFHSPYKRQFTDFAVE